MLENSKQFVFKSLYEQARNGKNIMSDFNNATIYFLIPHLFIIFKNL
jgi:hypothetical protein